MTARGHEPADLADVLDAPAGDGETTDAVLPTFAVLARFRSTAREEPAALAEVRDRVEGARGLWDDVLPERQEPDGTWQVLVRFVVVSVDTRTAVEGVLEALARDAGTRPEEAWVDARLS